MSQQTRDLPLQYRAMTVEQVRGPDAADEGVWAEVGRS